MNRLRQLNPFGQSPWYDSISRRLITSGDLARLINEEGLCGMTSNPSIFEKAIGGSDDYTEAIETFVREGAGVQEIYERLAIRDIQDAADLFYPVYQQTGGKDGYVSLEVSPALAHDTQGTCEEARRLWEALHRENVMIKVPATPEGIPAIETLVADGLSINVTLLFSVAVYEKVAWAYIAGLEKRAKAGKDLRRIASVASFFVSRIDTLIDERLALQIKERPAQRAVVEGLIGKVAIANAKIAYLTFQEIFSHPRYRALQDQGAKVQRLLWASTSTKNPEYPDTYYVEALIGADTVNTMPEATYNAFRDHGKPAATLLTDIEQAQATLNRLKECGVDMEQITQKLIGDGVRLFRDAFDQLMSTISKKQKALWGATLNQQRYAVRHDTDVVAAELSDFKKKEGVRRFWAKDPTLWHNDPAHHKIIRNMMGWLDIIEQEIRQVPHLQKLAESVRLEGFTDLLLIGMGGSSLCPEVMQKTFGVIPGFPKLYVLDSTTPAQIKRIAATLNLERTLFIVASKSGSTIEPTVLYQYFFEAVRKIKGDGAGKHFMAITDPGSLLERIAKENGFYSVLPGVPDIGGRYSALSHFGMVPAALMGVDVASFLDRAKRMRISCEGSVPPEDNPGAMLGVVLGAMAKQGKDKVTFITSPAIASLGSWLEQLIAESTGKEGKGILPVDEEAIGSPHVYGNDRLFVYIRHEKGVDRNQDEAVLALEKAGHPVIRIEIPEVINLGQEFFLWEMATAVASAILGINPFDQPNVQESKDYTQGLLAEYKKTGCLPEEAPMFVAGGIAVYADENNRKALGVGGTACLEDLLRLHLARVVPGDYVAINLYLDKNEANDHLIQKMRRTIRDKKKVATTVGYGPRFLHSTGQFHKGGKNSGVFIQITSDDAEDITIPGERYTFGILKRAQALGDFMALNNKNRRIIRIHLGSDVEKGLTLLQTLLTDG